MEYSKTVVRTLTEWLPLVDRAVGDRCSIEKRGSSSCAFGMYTVGQVLPEVVKWFPLMKAGWPTLSFCLPEQLHVKSSRLCSVTLQILCWVGISGRFYVLGSCHVQAIAEFTGWSLVEVTFFTISLQETSTWHQDQKFPLLHSRQTCVPYPHSYSSALEFKTDILGQKDGQKTG